MGASPMPMPTEANAHGGLYPMPVRAPHVTEKGYIKCQLIPGTQRVGALAGIL